MKDRVLAIVVMVGALAYLYADTQMPVLTSSDPLGPKIFPALIGSGLFLSGLLLLMSTYRAKAVTLFSASPPSSQGLPEAVEPTTLQRRQHRIVLLCMAVWTAIYYVAFDPVGYILSTIVYMLALLAYFNRGRHLANVLIALGFTFCAFFVFAKILGINMPLGPFGS